MARFTVRDQVSSVYFNQNGSYLNVTTNAGLQATTFTLAAWIMPSKFDTNTFQNNIVATESSNTGICLRIGNGRPEIVVGSGAAGPSATGPKMLGTGLWYHIAATYDGATIKLYINGLLVGSTASASYSPSSVDMRIGRGTLNTRDYNGYINDIYFYNTALSDVDGLYRGTNVPTSGQVMKLLCNENTGTTANDTSGNGNHGVFTSGSGAPAWSTNRRFGNRNAVS